MQKRLLLLYSLFTCLTVCSLPFAGAQEIQSATPEVKQATAEVQAATEEIKIEVKVTETKKEKQPEKKAKEEKSQPQARTSSRDVHNEIGDIKIENHGIQAIFINSDVTIHGGTIKGEINHGVPAAAGKDEDDDEKKEDNGDKTPSGRAGAREEREKPSKFAELTKDATKQEGIFTVYKAADKIYLEVLPEQLKKQYLISAALATGVGAGWLKPGTYMGNTIIDKVIVAFENINGKLNLLQKNLRFTSTKDEMEALAVARNHGDSLVASFPYEATNPENSGYLIDVSKFLQSDFFQLGDELRTSLGVGYGMDPANTYIQSATAFPENLLVRTHYAFRSGTSYGTLVVPDSRSVMIELLMDIRPLKDNPEFDARPADTRVGYFIDAHVDFSDDAEPSPFVRNIVRWDVRKASPELEISPPAKPIVMWLENTIPDRYKEPIRLGILDWNKAFEKIGIKDAIQVHDMPKDATWDAADARYNVVHWNTSFSSLYSGMAQWISDPRSGEVLNGGFLLESESIRGALNLLRRRNPTDRMDSFKALFETVTDQTPNFHHCNYQDNIMDQAAFGLTVLAARHGIANVTEPLAEEFINQLLFAVSSHEMGHVLGLRHNFEGSTHLPLEDLHNKAITAERSLSSSIMDYAPVNIAPPGREQGYFFEPTIGPYDYFAIEYGYKPLVASATGVSATATNTSEGTSNSSNASNPIQAATPEVSSATPEASAAATEVAAATAEVKSATAEPSKATPAAAKLSAEEKRKLLNLIAEKGEADPYRFGTDEDLYQYGGVDPLVNQNDLSNDPLGYAKQLTGVIRETIPLLPRIVDEGETYYIVRDAFDRMLYYYYSSASFAVKYLGGQYANRVKKGGTYDTQPLVPVSPAKQREALEFILNTIFTDELYTFDPSLLNLMLAEKWYHWGDTRLGQSHDYPLVDVVGSIYDILLYNIYSPRTLRQIQNSEQQRPEQAVNFTLPELFNMSHESIWREVNSLHESITQGAQNGGSLSPMSFSQKSPMVSVYRRILQRQHLKRMIEMALEPTFGLPEDARTLAWNNLNELRTRLDYIIRMVERSTNLNVDDYSIAHLRESNEKIKRALDARLNVRVDFW